jgi:hypothetical protein
MEEVGMTIPPAPPNDNKNGPIDKKWLAVLILGVGTLLYVLAVIWIGVGSVQHVRAINAAQNAANASPGAGSSGGEESSDQQAETPKPYPISDFVSKAILVIGGALATHLGAYLGISISQGILQSGQSMWQYIQSPEGFSGLLAFTYFFTLVLSIIFWALTGFSVYAGQPLQDLAYAFLGVFAGSMAALAKGQ